MQKNVWMAIIALTAVAGGYFLWRGAQKPGELDQFALCLGDKGAVFYGAFWCKYCNAQKKMFGASQKLLPYEECSTPDGRSQLPFCKDKGITSYPLWEFADGSRLNGVVSFEQLAEKTSCVLPTENNSQ